MAAATRLDHVNITVRDLDAVVPFFLALGLEADGEAQVVEGPRLDDVTGVDGARNKIMMLRVPGADVSLELSQFLAPVTGEVPHDPPTHELGLRSVAFEVDDVEAVLDRLAQDGYGLVRGLAQFEDVYKLCYVRGPEGVIVMLAQSLG